VSTTYELSRNCRARINVVGRLVIVG